VRSGGVGRYSPGLVPAGTSTLRSAPSCARAASQCRALARPIATPFFSALPSAIACSERASSASSAAGGGQEADGRVVRGRGDGGVGREAGFAQLDARHVGERAVHGELHDRERARLGQRVALRGGEGVGDGAVPVQDRVHRRRVGARLRGDRGREGEQDAGQDLLHGVVSPCLLVARPRGDELSHLGFACCPLCGSRAG
jgi:hypothetical protein